MKKRVFIGINLPEKEKRLLTKTINKWADLPVRWTKQASLHTTVLFIGSASDDEIIEICDNVKQAARENGPFDLEFNRISFGPEQDRVKLLCNHAAQPEKSLRNHAAQPEKSLRNHTANKPGAPRMIWAFGEKSEELASLKNAIERQLFGIGEHRIEHAKNPIVPHITLGRIYGSRWKKLDNPPKIDEKISFSVPVESVEIMESNPVKDGVEYIILESVKL